MLKPEPDTLSHFETEIYGTLSQHNRCIIRLKKLPRDSQSETSKLRRRIEVRILDPVV